MNSSELRTGDVFVSNRKPPEDVGVVIASGPEASDSPYLFVAGWFEPDGECIRIEHSVNLSTVINVTETISIPEIIEGIRQFGSPSSMNLWIPFLEKMIIK